MSNTSAYLYLNSDDRNNKPDPNTVDVNFNTNFRDNTARRLALSSYDFVTGFDNINSSNQVGYIDDGTTSYPLFIPTRVYDIFELRDELIIQLGLLGLGAWAITINQGSYDIIAPVPVKFLKNPLNQNGWDWIDMIGIEKETPLSLFHNGGILDIAYTNKIYITSPELCQFKTLGDEATNERVNNCIGVVYLNSNVNLGSEKIPLSPPTILPSHATRQIENLKWIMHRSASDIGTVSIIMLDDRGQRIPTEQGKNMRWSIELIVQD